MKVLVVGSGGREHTLVWKLRGSRKVKRVFCAPGNGGISQIAKCVNVKADNVRALADFAAKNRINLTVVGPEVPLALGIVDEFRRRKLRIFGPDKSAAQIESSKIFAKEFMRKYHIPTAPFKTFEIAAEAIGFCKSSQYPLVIKADGLAAGKGVVIAKSHEDAVRTIEQIMIERRFGDAGDRILIESFVVGQEMSIMAITDGKAVRILLPSQDHKQAYDSDRGPNTGGMGVVCPTAFATPEVMSQIEEHIILPTIHGLGQEGITYKGVLYAGIMLTESGPRVLEFNCRFGDPETQAVLPLLKSDFFNLLMATVNRELAGFGHLSWRSGTSVCVTMASKGYPGKYTTGLPISNLPKKPENGTYVFHAGTELKGNRLVTAGGRVLGVTAIDKDLKAARERAYRLVKRVSYDGAMFRTDIGFRELNAKEETAQHA